jgi:hypothetical protein
MAGKTATGSTAWAQPTDMSADFRSCGFTGAKGGRDQLSAYQEYRHLDGALGSSSYWQTSSCAQPGFQVTSEGTTMPNVECKSYSSSHAGYERQQQILDGLVSRQLDLPDSVLKELGNGLDVDAAYAQAGAAPPIPGLAPPKPAPPMRAVAGGGRAMRAVAGASLGMSGAHTNSLSVFAAYGPGGRVMSSLALPGQPAFSAAGSPANMTEPGKPAPPAAPGAMVYTRQHESGSGTTTYATRYLGAGGAASAYTQSDAAAGALSTSFRGQ